MIAAERAWPVLTFNSGHMLEPDAAALIGYASGPPPLCGG
jgi:hypothetical protein